MQVKRLAVDFDNTVPRSIIDRNHSNNNDNTSRKIEQMLSQLNEEELEIAARTSYEYIKHHSTQQPQKLQQDEHEHEQQSSLSNGKKYARIMARRYLESKMGHVDVATKKMKDTIRFRKQIDMDSLCRTFDDNNKDDIISDHENNHNNNNNPVVDNNEQNNQSPRRKLESMLSSKRNYVQGYDIDGRSTHIFVPRRASKNTHDREWTLRESLYTIERAIACSKATDHSINTIIDFRGFRITEHAPPFEIGKEFLLTLRHHYAGQVHKIFIVDAPVGFSFFWNLFKQFVGKSTQSKIMFLVSGQNKDSVLQKYYTDDEATPWMLSNGLKTQELDVQDYLYHTPFDQAYNE